VSIGNFSTAALLTYQGITNGSNYTSVMKLSKLDWTSSYYNL